MPFRICKSFEVESGHMLFKHPSLCRFPHGHSRRVEVVLAADRLDASDMVCDFKVIKLALAEHLASYDHAMFVNSDDPVLQSLSLVRDRVVALPSTDPTTEVLAQRIFKHLHAELAARRTYIDTDGSTYRFPPGIRLERVRVTETSSTWAEYAE